jgi:hypothetical protein
VVVFDEGRRWQHQLQRLGDAYGVDIQVTVGTGVYLGEESRSLARIKFRELIASYEMLSARPRYRPGGPTRGCSRKEVAEAPCRLLPDVTAVGP